MATGTTVADKLAHLSETKTDILAALAERGVSLPAMAKLGHVAALVRSLPQGDVSAYEVAWSPNRRTMASLVAPEGITVIGYGAFNNCPELRTLTLPTTLRTIGGIAFANCQKLEALQIPEGVTEIGGGAFNGCYGLTTLCLPSRLSVLDSAVVFQGCPTTCDITFERPLEVIKAITFYPWGLKKGTVIHCSNGDLTV